MSVDGNKSVGSVDMVQGMPMSFADSRAYANRPIGSFGSQDFIMDEESIHWKVFFMRVFLIVLLVMMIASLAMYALSPKFLFLACIICAFLIICLVWTFVDLSFLCPCIPCCRKQDVGPPLQTSYGQSQNPPPPQSLDDPVENPFGNYHNKL